MSDKKIKKLVNIALRSVLRSVLDGSIEKRNGICFLASEMLGDITVGFEEYNECKGYMRRLMDAWPEASGNYSYPVPHPRLDPSDAYFYAWGKWSRWTRYGRARRRLLIWMIEQTNEPS